MWRSMRNGRGTGEAGTCPSFSHAYAKQPTQTIESLATQAATG